MVSFITRMIFRGLGPSIKNMESKIVKFSVRAHTKSSELLMVVGGCSELGNWEVKNGVKLAKNGEKVNGCVIFFKRSGSAYKFVEHLCFHVITSFVENAEMLKIENVLCYAQVGCLVS